MLKTLAHGAVGALLVSSAAAQSRSPGSFARCRITAKGFANSKSEEVSVAVGASTASADAAAAAGCICHHLHRPVHTVAHVRASHEHSDDVQFVSSNQELS